MTTPIENVPASSIPGVRNYLFAQLQALLLPDPDSPDVSLEVCLDGPSTDQPGDVVSVGDVHQNYSPENTVGSGGAYWLREDYTVTVTIDCWRGTDDAAAVFLRARSLADLVVTLVRSDPSLGQLVDRAKPSSATHTSGYADGVQGRQTVIELGIDCLKTL